MQEVGLGQRHNLLDSRDDLDYDSDPLSSLHSRSGFYPDLADFHAIFTRGVSLPKDQSIKFGDDPNYDLDLGHKPSKTKVVQINNMYYLKAKHSTTAI